MFLWPACLVVASSEQASFMHHVQTYHAGRLTAVATGLNSFRTFCEASDPLWLSDTIPLPRHPSPTPPVRYRHGVGGRVESSPSCFCPGSADVTASPAQHVPLTALHYCKETHHPMNPLTLGAPCLGPALCQRRVPLCLPGPALLRRRCLGRGERPRALARALVEVVHLPVVIRQSHPVVGPGRQRRIDSAGTTKEITTRFEKSHESRSKQVKILSCGSSACRGCTHQV
jgi:hypothetical protein